MSCPSGPTDLSVFIADRDPDVTVKCEEWRWQCHRDILCASCPFFDMCCNNGFEETEARRIKLVDDNPRAVDALLRFLYTCDTKQILPPGRDIFEDIELNLDIYIVADKYDVPQLRNYMQDQILFFYQSNRNPTGESKYWGGRSQARFGAILDKLYTIENDTSAIQIAVVDFIVHNEGRVMQWPDVVSAIDEYPELGSELLQALLRSRRQLESRVVTLEAELDDHKEQLEDLQQTCEELEGTCEELQDQLAGAENLYCQREDSSEWDCYSHAGSLFYQQYGVNEHCVEQYAQESEVTPSAPLDGQAALLAQYEAHESQDTEWLISQYEAA